MMNSEGASTQLCGYESLSVVYDNTEGTIPGPHWYFVTMATGRNVYTIHHKKGGAGSPLLTDTDHKRNSNHSQYSAERQ